MSDYHCPTCGSANNCCHFVEARRSGRASCDCTYGEIRRGYDGELLELWASTCEECWESPARQWYREQLRRQLEAERAQLGLF